MASVKGFVRSGRFFICIFFFFFGVCFALEKRPDDREKTAVAQINIACRNQKWSDALLKLEHFFSEFPDSKAIPKARVLAGYVCVRIEEEKSRQAKQTGKNYQPDYTRAIYHFLVVVEKYKNEPAVRAEAMFFAALYLNKQGTDESKKQAYSILNSLYKDYPDSKWTKMWLGWFGSPQCKARKK